MITILTGNPKSGNSWLGRMLRELVPSNDCGHEIFDWVRSHYVNQSITKYHKLCDRRIPARQLLQRIFLQADRIETELGENELVHLRTGLSELAKSIRSVMARSNCQTDLNVDSITELLLERATSKGNANPQNNVLCTGKHTPVSRIAEVFPDSKVIWLIRDPRDVLVSYFFHELACLTQNKLPMVFADSDFTKLKPLDDCVTSILKDRVAEIVDFFGRSPKLDSLPANVLLVRYENLLEDTRQQLNNICKFGGFNVEEPKVTAVAEKFQFKNLKDSAKSNQSRGSFLRKGIAGDWQNYFGKQHQAILAGGLSELVSLLGYEENENWVDDVPEKANSQFDLGRYRPKLSTLYNFEPTWLDSEEVQAKFPMPYDTSAANCFYKWLSENRNEEFTNWFRICDMISEHFGCVEGDHRTIGESKLGF